MADFKWGEIRIEDAALAGGFVQLPAVVMFDPDLSSGAKITYGALLWYGWKHGRCPEQKVMAADLGVSLRTIQSHISELERANYIEVVQFGLGKPNAYIVKTLQGRENALTGPIDPDPQNSAGLGRNIFPDPQKTAGLARRKLRVKDAENCGSYYSSIDVRTIQQQQELSRPGSSAAGRVSCQRYTCCCCS